MCIRDRTEGVTLTVKVAVMPEVKVGNYNGLTVEKTVHTAVSYTHLDVYKRQPMQAAWPSAPSRRAVPRRCRPPLKRSWLRCWSCLLYTSFLAANLLTGAFNLLPIPPLDGAQLAACGWWCLQNNDCISR